jgi:hypothetical protein
VTVWAATGLVRRALITERLTGSSFAVYKNGKMFSVFHFRKMAFKDPVVVMSEKKKENIHVKEKRCI